MSQLKKIEEQLNQAPSMKAMMMLDFIQERFTATYQGTTGKKDGKSKFQLTVFEYLDIINENPALAKAERFSHFAAIVKIARKGLPLSKLYIMPGKNNTIRVESTPAGKREMLESMKEIKQVPEAQLVLKGDLFIHDRLSNIIEVHKTTEKSVTFKNLDDVVASYQRIRWNNGDINDVVVYHAAILKAKAKSPAQSDAAFWNQWPDEAAKKVATNRAYRLYHKYPDNEFEFNDDDAENDDTQDVIHTEVDDQQVNKETGEVKEVAAPAGTASTLSQAEIDADDFLKK